MWHNESNIEPRNSTKLSRSCRYSITARSISCWEQFCWDKERKWTHTELLKEVADNPKHYSDTPCCCGGFQKRYAGNGDKRAIDYKHDPGQQSPVDAGYENDEKNAADDARCGDHCKKVNAIAHQDGENAGFGVHCV